MSFTLSLPPSLASPPSLVPPLHNLPPLFSLRNTVLKPTITTSTRQQLFASSCLAAKAATSPSETALETTLTPAHEVVSSFYAAINVHDLSSVTDLIAQDCVYEDLVFSSPFVGRTAILEFFGKFIEATSTDLQFVIDDISKEDTSAVGVSWHLEWKGKNFPFSKGCSFYRLEVIDGKRQIVYGRDCVEPAIKPGDTVLAAIKGVTWLLQKFPQLADQF
ncbi:Nuclear transport factor 2 [Hirschfeldia incana]|nr:Nuclear transport factor 2 [Hirschfeldia incana]